MCEANKRFFLYLLLALLFVSVAGALRAEEPGPWYLISEAELQSIERYRNSREAERQAWLSQASGLNDQLAAQREANRNLTASFNKYEADQLTLVSLKNGEIAKLEKEKAEKALEAEKYKGASRNRLFIIIALAGSWIVFIVFKAWRFFRPI